MTPQTNFLGIPLDKYVERRCFVVGYYAVFSSIAIFCGFAHGIWLMGSEAVLFLFAFHAIHRVRKQGSRTSRELSDLRATTSDLYPILSLNLDRRLRPIKASIPDEREVAIRDQAFRRAYTILISVIFLLPLAVAAFQIGWLSIPVNLYPWLMLILLNFLLTLPRAVLLWTQPDDLGLDKLSVIRSMN
jgi:hypothetical protein